MLHEPASAPDYRPRPLPPELAESPQKDPYEKIGEYVQAILDVEFVFQVDPHDLGLEDQALIVRGGNETLVSYRGQLLMEPETAYAHLDALLAPLHKVALFREKSVPTSDGKIKKVHIIHILNGRFKTPTPFPTWPNLALLVATILSVLVTGALIAVGEVGLTDPAAAAAIENNLLLEMWRGLPYAISIMLILGTHEMGHYLMMARRGVAATLPYFLPLPLVSPFGTLGAAIMLRGPIRNRKVLFDIGAAGPLAGLVFAIPILLIGLATSPVQPITPGGMVEGNSILYATAKIITLGEFLPNGKMDVILNQLAWAGWSGLFVTALNLLPLGQLDGGHVLYSLLGEHARRLFVPLIGIILGLVLFVSEVWLLLLVMLFFFGRVYAVPLDNITRLDRTRRNLAVLTLVIFGLIFVPIPLAISGEEGGLLLQGVITPVLGITITGLLWMARQRLGSGASPS